MDEATPAAGIEANRLLILDDDELVGMLVETVARLAGLTTQLTADHEAFFSAITDWRPDIVLIDLTMPGLSGEDVLRGLAQRQCPARIIISSGVEPQRLADAAALATASGLKMAGTLPKPFSPATLRALLGKA